MPSPLEPSSSRTHAAHSTSNSEQRNHPNRRCQIREERAPRPHGRINNRPVPSADGRDRGDATGTGIQTVRAAGAPPRPIVLAAGALTCRAPEGPACGASPRFRELRGHLSLGIFGSAAANRVWFLRLPGPASRPCGVPSRECIWMGFMSRSAGKVR
jgi:hypothetical protein